MKNFKALIEMCAGNFANQETIFKGHVVDSINLILKYLVENNALLFEVQYNILSQTLVYIVAIGNSRNGTSSNVL